MSVIDIFDINDQQEEIDRDPRGRRYRVEIDQGPGELLRFAGNDSGGPWNFGDLQGGDLIPGDNIDASLYHISREAGADQIVVLSIVDEGVSGFPTTTTALQVGKDPEIIVFASPSVTDPGDQVQIIAFVRDEFGLLSVDHELVLTIEEGSAGLASGGRMIDDGGSIGDFRDAFTTDGVYTGVIQTTGTAEGRIVVRVTDLSLPSQPTATVEIIVGQ